MSKYTEEFKTKVGLEAAKGESSLKVIGEKFGVHPTLVRNWRIKYAEEQAEDSNDALTVVCVNTYPFCDRNDVDDPSSLAEDQAITFCVSIVEEVREAFSNNVDEDIDRLFVRSKKNGVLTIVPISEYLESPCLIESVISEDEAVFFISELDSMDWASSIIMISDELETSITLYGPHGDHDDRIVKQGYDCGDLDTGIVEDPDEIETYGSESFENIYESYFAE